MRRLPQEMFNLLFGKGVNAKLFRARILSYNNAFAFASVQYNRIPAAAHGVQSVKVQGWWKFVKNRQRFRKSWALSILCVALWE